MLTVNIFKNMIQMHVLKSKLIHTNPQKERTRQLEKQ